MVTITPEIKETVKLAFDTLANSPLAHSAHSVIEKSDALVQIAGGRANLSKCSSACSTCPFSTTSGMFDNNTNNKQLNDDQKTVGTFFKPIRNEYRKNLDAVWFCHHSVDPIFMPDIPGRLKEGTELKVCAGFLEWREAGMPEDQYMPTTVLSE